MRLSEAGLNGDTVRVHVDAACRGNHLGGRSGRVGLGVVVRPPGGEVEEFFETLPDPATNNIGEYHAVTRGIEIATGKYPNLRVLVYSDSKLVVETVRGHWRCRAEHLKPLVDRIQALCAAHEASVSVLWLPRDTTGQQMADALANKALDTIGEIDAPEIHT